MKRKNEEVEDTNNEKRSIANKKEQRATVKKIKPRKLPFCGEKIEVQWNLHNNDGTVKSIWWRATYLRSVKSKSCYDEVDSKSAKHMDVATATTTTSTTNDNSDNNNINNNISDSINDFSVLKMNKNELHEILYEAMHGFDAEKRSISFIDNHISYDAAEKDYLFWRTASTDWNPPAGMSANEYVGSTPGYENLIIMSAEDLVLDQQRLEQDHQNGISVEQLGFAALNTLPHQQQINGALA
jgi:hypothetical protein